MRRSDKEQIKQLTPGKWQALSEEWEQSGLTQLKFCQRKDIPLKTFTNQRQKILPAKRNIQNHFLPALINERTVGPLLSQSVNLKLPNGICLEIAANTDKTVIRAIFELLGIQSC